MKTLLNYDTTLMTLVVRINCELTDQRQRSQANKVQIEL